MYLIIRSFMDTKMRKSIPGFTLKVTTMKYALILTLCISQSVFAQIPTAEVQLKTAVLAAPEEKRAGAMVYGYDAKGKFVVLRKGSNEIICLADNPTQKGFSVSCYHQDLEPFMARGRELKDAGKPPRKYLTYVKRKQSQESWRCRSKHPTYRSFRHQRKIIILTRGK